MWPAGVSGGVSLKRPPIRTWDSQITKTILKHRQPFFRHVPLVYKSVYIYTFPEPSQIAVFWFRCMYMCDAWEYIYIYMHHMLVLLVAVYSFFCTYTSGSLNIVLYVHVNTMRCFEYMPAMSYLIGSMHAIYGNMDPINIPPMLAYIPYMDPIGIGNLPAKMFCLCFATEVWYSIFRGRCHRRWAR